MRPESTTPSPVERAAHDREAQTRAVVQQLRIVYRAMQEHSRWVEKQCGVTAAQLWALWELAARPGLRVSELSQALSLHQSTTSNLLDKLEKKDLVARRRGGPDQRVVQIDLTATGADIVARAPRPAQGAISAALAHLPEAELAGLERGLAALIGCMEGADPGAALRPLMDDMPPAE
ncbi:MAG: MarR family winged helix-turn-helix transcriptional regulator [Gammaproteobacteria bacterium]